MLWNAEYLLRNKFSYKMDTFNMQTHQQIAALHSNTTPEYYNMKVGAVGMFTALLTS